MSDEVTLDQDAELLRRGQTLSAQAGGAPQLPGYELPHALGEGSFGAVWGGTQLRTGQPVAVKVLLRTGGLNLGFFAAELDRLIQVAEHPHIVSVLDADLSHRPPFFVMSWVKGGSLAKRGKCSLPEALRWLEQLAEALCFTHDKGLIHCDLKPSNLLLDESENLRVADFGQSRSLRLEEGALGTIGFMAPEQSRLGTEERGATPNVRWDVYAAGATFYWLLTGQTPRILESDRQSLSELGSSTTERLAAYRELLHKRRMVPIRELRAEVDQDLAELVEHMLEVDPDQRTASFREVLEDLRRRRQGEPLLCRRPWSAGYRLRRWLSRPLVAVSVLATTALLALGVASYFRVLAEKRKADHLLVQAQIERGQAAEELGDHTLALLWWQRALQGRPQDTNLKLRMHFHPYALVHNSQQKPAGELGDEESPLEFNELGLRLRDEWVDRQGKLIPTPAAKPKPQPWEPLHYNGLTLRQGDLQLHRLSGPSGNGWWARLYQGDKAISPPLPQSGFFAPMALTPDGGRAALRAHPGSGNGRPLTGCSVDVYDTRSGQLVLPPLEHRDKVHALAFSPDGSQLACGCADGSVWVWQLESGTLVTGGLRMNSGVTGLAYSPDGKLLAGWAQDGDLRMWDARQSLMRTLPAGVNPRTAWGKAGLTVLNQDGWTRYDPIDLLPIGQHKEEFTYEAVLSADGSWIADRSGQQIRLLSTEGASERTFPLKGKQLMALLFAEKTQELVVLSGDPEQEQTYVTRCQQGSTQAFAFNGVSSRQLLTPAGDGLLVCDDKSLNICRLDSGEMTEIPGGVSAAALSPDEKWLGLGDHAGQVQILATPARRAKPHLRVDSKFEADRRIYDLRFTPDSSLAVSVSGDGQIGGWRSRGPAYAALRFPHSLPTSMDLDEHKITAACGDGLVRLWSLREGHALSPWITLPEPIDQVCLSPTGTAACLQGRDQLFILDLSEEQPINVEAWTGCHLDPEEGTIRVNSQEAR